MLQQKIQDLIAREMEAIQNIPVDGVIQEAIDVIHRQVHELGGKVVVSGLGKAGQIGLNISTTLSSTGTPAIFLHPSEAQHGDLGIVCPNDVLLLVSNSGRTREVVELQALANVLVPGIPVIVLTGNPEGELSQLADVVLLTGGPKEICPLGLTPTTSTTVMTVIGDILVVLMIEKIGFTREEYGKRHHGGYLGKQARSGK